MIPISKIAIPGNGDIKLSPGGIHVMLYNLKRSLKEGDIISFNLEFENGYSTTTQAVVRR
jgi:copper(I)-binding protein